MKALCQSAWLLTVAFGNLVVVIIAESSIFENQVSLIHHHLYTPMSLLQAYEFLVFFAGSIESSVCESSAEGKRESTWHVRYFYKYVDPNWGLSPSFTSDLRVDQVNEVLFCNVPKDGRENRSLMRERESPPPPYYGDDMMATSDVDDTSQP